jgi:hypothetical protein
VTRCVIASEAKQSSLKVLYCFVAELVIGPAISGQTRWRPPQEAGFGQVHVSGRGAPGRPAPLTASNSSTVNSLIVFLDSLMICSVIPTPLRLPGAVAWTNRSLIMIARSYDGMAIHELKTVQLRNE